MCLCAVADTIDKAKVQLPCSFCKYKLHNYLEK